MYTCKFVVPFSFSVKMLIFIVLNTKSIYGNTLCCCCDETESISDKGISIKIDNAGKINIKNLGITITDKSVLNLEGESYDNAVIQCIKSLDKKCAGSNVNIGRTTMFMCERIHCLQKCIDYSIKHQGYIPNSAEVGNLIKEEGNKEKTNIYFTKKRTTQAAVTFSKFYNNSKICIHNFANAYSVGGNFLGGATAQEEEICRVSILYKCLIDEKVGGYYNHNKEEICCGGSVNNCGCKCVALIYTPDVVILKNYNSEDKIYTLDKEAWIKVAVITAAAPCSPDKKTVDQKLIHKAKLERMLYVAKDEGNDTIILGAFGCGAFENNIQDLAEAYAEVLSDVKFKDMFKNIIFAIYDSSGVNNYGNFKKNFMSKIKSVEDYNIKEGL